MVLFIVLGKQSHGGLDMSATESLQQICECLKSAEADAAKHERGVDAAGARLRKKLQQIVSCCKELRAEVQAERNARKTQ